MTVRFGPALLLAGCLGLAAPAQGDHAIAMHGTPKYPEGFTQFDYVDPDAPKGGLLRLGVVGTFDSLNRHIVRGVPAEGLRQWNDQSLLRRSQDEPFSLYAGLAEAVTMADDRRSVDFRLRAGAKFQNGADVTVEDVIFSRQTLQERGRPNHRTFYKQVARIERTGPRSLRFVFAPDASAEMPLIMGFMPVFSKAGLASRRFNRVSLEPLPTAGPYRIAAVDPGRSITYERLRDHWSRDLPAFRGQNNFDRVRYEYFRDVSSLRETLKAGRIDLHEETDARIWALETEQPERDGARLLREELPHRRAVGMFGVALNARRPMLGDPKVRAALAEALDFAWLNRNLFHGAYRRTGSFFENSDLAARERPSGAEIALLAPWRDSLPATVFERAYLPPQTDGSGNLRGNLRRARALLQNAGWRVRDGVLRNAEGLAMELELMLLRRPNERIGLHLKRNLKRLGIALEVRLVDSAQYQERLASYDFDALIWHWSQSLSPGNEQAFYWHSRGLTQQGTRNYPGIAHPAVDHLVGRIADARSREDLTTATRALDRVLTWGHHVIPLFHLRSDRVAYWSRLARPDRTPLYGYRLSAWWARGAAGTHN